MTEYDKYYNIIEGVNFGFNYRYGLSYLTQESYNVILDSLSHLRRTKDLNGDEYHLLVKIFGHQYNNLTKIRNLEAEEPRLIAQKFIGKKNIREFIFKRDNYKCLACPSKDKLEIDHIVPISRGGENKIGNLQTLCKSCNSRKRDNFIDYR